MTKEEFLFREAKDIFLMYLRAVKVESYERQSAEARYYESLKNYAETLEEAATVATLFQMVQKLNEEVIDLRAKL